MILRVREICDLFNLDVVSGKSNLDREVTGGYCGDLLSDVIANSSAGNVWLTIQGHQNIVAVAALKQISAIIIVNGRSADAETVAKAEEEGISILLSSKSAFEMTCLLGQAGLGK